MAPRWIFSPYHVFLILTGTIFSAEVVVMGLLYLMPPIPRYLEALLDAAVLVAIVFPFLYTLLFRLDVKDEGKRFGGKISPVHVLAILSVVIFGAEVFIMALLASLPALPEYINAVLDAVLLIVFIFPFLYIYLFRPLVSNIDELEGMKERLVRANLELEERVLRRTARLSEVNETLEKEVAAHRLANAELRKSEERLRGITSAANDAIILLDIAGKVIFWNPAAEKIFGYAEEEIRGREASEYLVPEEYREKFRDGLASLMGMNDDPAGRKRRELIGRRKSGEAFPLELSISSITVGEGRGIVGIVRDITERREAERALEEHTGFLRTVMDSIQAPFYVVRAGDYSIEMANAAACGSNICEGGKCYEAGHGLKEPCDVGSIPCPIDEVKRTKKAVSLEHVHCGSDGRRVVSEVHAYPIVDASGEVNRIIEYVLDITERKRAEEELKREKEKAQKYFDTAGVMLLVIGKDRRVSLINRKGCAVLGCEEGEIIGKDWFDNFLHPSQRERVKDVFDRLVAGEAASIEYFENPVLTKGGEERIIAWHNSVLKDERGRVAAVISSGEDITLHIRMENELRSSRSRMEYLLKSTPAVIYTAVPFGRFAVTFVSENVEEQMGYRADEFLSDPDFWINHVHPDDRERVLREAGGVLEKGFLPYEYRFLHRNGEYRWMLDDSRLMRDREGRPREIVGYWINITDRRKMEDTIRESENEIRAITDAMQDALIMADADGKVTFWNPAAERMLGFSRKEAIGKPLREWLAPIGGVSDKECLMNPAAVPEELEKLKILECLGKRKNGESFSIELSQAPLVLEGQSYLVVIIRDISERKKTEEILARTEKLASIGTLASGVAHEILNPLNIMSTIVQLLQRKNRDAETLEVVDELETQIRRAAKITNNLRMFSHKKKAEVKELRLEDVIEDILGLLEHDMKLENIEVVKDYEHGLPPVQADEDRLAQVFLNLISNARDAISGREGGKITIGMKRKGAGIEISFADTGTGIPGGNLGRIFDPFFTTKEPGKGTGLGLAIAHNVVEEQGGTLSVRSMVGEGATFTINLPLEPAMAGKDQRF